MFIQQIYYMEFSEMGRGERERISIRLLIQHFPNLPIKGRVLASQSVVIPSLKNLIYRKRLTEFGLERGNLEL